MSCEIVPGNILWFRGGFFSIDSPANKDGRVILQPVRCRVSGEYIPTGHRQAFNASDVQEQAVLVQATDSNSSS